MANEMRDRLVKLLEQKMHPYLADDIADHLIENGVIVPPCKIGDTGSIVFAEKCFTFKNKLIFTNALGKEVAVFNWDEIKGYKLTDVREL